MDHKFEKGFALDNVHSLISKSQSVGINMDTAMEPGVQVFYYKHEPGANFLIAIEESTIDFIIESATEKALLKKKSDGSDRIVVAIIKQSADNQEDYDIYPIIESSDELFLSWLGKFGDRFFRLIDNYGRWPSFTKFLKEDNMYDVNNTEPLKQAPLGYHFLVGSLSDSAAVHQVGHLPPNKGVYVASDSDQELIPVFTSAIYADIYAQQVKEKFGSELQADLLPCVKCYISGSYRSFETTLPNGIILNSQWIVDCYDCNICDNSSGHFFLNDGDNVYALCGCSELGVKPIWIEKRWDENMKYFNPICGMSKL